MTDKTKRVLFIISRFLDGGIDTVLAEYLSYLSSRSDYRITLAITKAMGEQEVFKDRLPASIRVVYLTQSDRLMRIYRKRIVGEASKKEKLFDEIVLNPIRRWGATSKLKKLAKEHDAIVDFDSCAYSLIKDIPILKVAFFHFSISEFMTHERRRMKRVGMKLKTYDKIVMISKAMADECVKYFPELEDKLVTIYNAQNIGAIAERAAEDPGDERINERYIVAVERLTECQKDISTLIKAFHLLKTSYGHTREKLFIIGQGNSEEELRSLAEQLGISESIVFLGFKGNPYPWIKRSVMLVHSSKFEGLPTILIEGLMLNKLMVATDCPTGPREILAGGKAGLLVPVGDADAMASAIHRLLTDGELQADILANVRMQARRFTFDTTGPLFEDIITRKTIQ
ncbi:MAG: glycosyltransferase [Prevotella sp.]|nr:glycosyltransferase [Prevotella sp.]